MTNPTSRFTSRVDNYVKYRPSYPQALIDALQTECQLTSASRIADIGSGTGILSALLLKQGFQVAAVEPNTAMREAAEAGLSEYSTFQSVNGTAEDTTLSDASIDLITAAQAFHWFERDKAKAEFRRILKPSGQVALIWNERQTDTTPFLVAYEELSQTFGTDYKAVRHSNIDQAIFEAFFSNFTTLTFENRQMFDFEGLKGRLLSSSYAPEAGHANHEPMIDELKRIFEANQVDGQVAFEYQTMLYLGAV